MNGGITHDEWNELVRALWRILNVQAIVLDGGGWRHPWQLVPVYDGSRWATSIRTGFINGRDPYITLPTTEAPAATLARLRRSSFDLRNASSVDCWLTEFPLLPLTSFRAIGPDAIPTDTTVEPDGSISVSYEPVPQYFLNLGVGHPPKTTVDAENGIVTQPLEEGTRLLRVLDVVLTQPRMATESDFQIEDGTQSTIFQYTVSTKNTAAIRKRAKIDTTPKYEPPNPMDPLQQLQGIWADDGLTHLLLASVYFVSPPGAEYGSAPDASWTPHIGHKVFWNLDFQTNQLPDALKNENLTLNTFLAGGVGDRLNEYLLSQVNDANSAVAQFLGRSTIEGRFWTV